MMQHLRKLLFYLFVCLLTTAYTQAQVNLSGVVKDAKTGEGLAGVNVVIQGTVTGGVTDGNGKFNITTNQKPPFKLQVSYIGYSTQMVDVTGSNSNLEIALKESNSLIGEVVVSASRVEEKIMESPVTIEKMDILAIKSEASPDFYDGLANLKGVHINRGSMNFASVNTRGFASIANVRMVQLMDGMDNAAPLLNFPSGNVVGISELDMESMELVPGAASALYGPNAFNGILMMNSKSPFEYQGLSAQIKGGVAVSNTSSNVPGAESQAYGTQPMYSGSVRYAKALLKNKLAFKVNVSWSQAQDWRANDYTTFRTDVFNVNDGSFPIVGDPNFDALNRYGDEVPIVAAFANPAFAKTVASGILASGAIDLSAFNNSSTLAQDLIANGLQSLGNVPLTRLGYKEEDMLESFDASSIKVSAAVHYRITEKLEASFQFRRGQGSSVYQGGERYALRDFSQTYYKAELKNPNFFVRAYMSETDDGDSYNMTALGLLTTQALAPTYIGTYAGALLPKILTGQTVTDADKAAAQAAAYAAVQPGAGTNLAEDQLKAVREGLFQRGGAGFIDNSRLYHTEFNYNFGHLIDFAEIQVGGNFRRYDLFSDGTVFNENQGNGTYERIEIDEFGFYTQISKKFDRLKATASIRYDKNENFDGQVTPRASLVYSAGKDREHNFRASFQTGFRNPDTQAQFIFFPSTSGILLGSTRANGEQYGIFNGGATDSRGNVVNIDFVQPEQLTAFEIGYKGAWLDGKLLVDINGYFNQYNNFIIQQTVFAANGGTAPTGSWTAGTAFRPYINAKVPVNSQGLGIGLSYRLYKGYILNGSYNNATFTADIDPNDEQQIPFNTPNDRFKISLSNRSVGESGALKNLGFSINYRWQDRFLWRSSFGHGHIPSFGVVDAQLSYKIKSLKSIVKIGGTNLGNNEYRTNFGGPFIGSMYYISLTFDQFLN